MKRRKIVAAVLFVLCTATVILCSFPAIFPWEKRLVDLLCETASRLAVALFLLALLWGNLRPPRKGLGRALLWSLPCFAVALANFPYSALLAGTARVGRPDLLWLFLLKCLSVALMEELFFRAMLLPLLHETLQKRRGGLLGALLLSSALFALMHLFNLFFGANWGATALQVGYTFLLGLMFGVTYCRTKNIWLCVAVHALFDVGGLLVADLGSGAPQDAVFWVLTAVAGVLCALHIAISAYRLQKQEDAQLGR